MSSTLIINKHFETLIAGLVDCDQDFDLDQELVKELLTEFNIKISQTSVGYICFKGSDIGGAAHAKSSGRAICNFLKIQNISEKSNVDDVIYVLRN